MPFKGQRILCLKYNIKAVSSVERAIDTTLVFNILCKLYKVVQCPLPWCLCGATQHGPIILYVPADQAEMTTP